MNAIVLKRIPIEEAEQHETEFGWPEPDMKLLGEGRIDAPALPLELFGPTLSKWLGEAADATGAPIDYVAGALLAAASATIGNARVVSPWPSWTEPPILWIGLVGDPSSGKSPAMDPFTRTLRDLERDWRPEFEAKRLKWVADAEIADAARTDWRKAVATAIAKEEAPPEMPSGAIAPEEPQPPRLVVNDTTMEALCRILSGNLRGVLQARDELAGLISGFDRYKGGAQGAERAFYIEAFGARPFVVDRVKNGGELRIDRVAVSILGAIQPDRFDRLVARCDDDGLASRFMWIWPERRPPRRPAVALDAPFLLTALRRLAALQPDNVDNVIQPKAVELTTEAAADFQKWREEHAAESATGLLAGAFGKLPGIVLRVALVLALLGFAADECAEPKSISQEGIVRAIGLVEGYVKQMLRRVYGSAAKSQVECDAAAIARWIISEKPRTLNARDLRREAQLGDPSLRRDHRRVDAALALLVESDWLRASPTRRGPTGGRRSKSYDVNPSLEEA